MTLPPDALPEQSYSPDHISMVREVYDDIIAEPWFVRDAEKREEFGRQVFRMFRQGLVIREKLHRFCHIMAQRRYAEPLEASEAGQTGPQ